MNSSSRIFLQGDLQKVFDVLYSMGAIDPMLRTDWRPIQSHIESNPQLLRDLVHRVNICGGNTHQIEEVLRTIDSQSLQILTMEVAREFAEFADRQTLH